MTNLLARILLAIMLLPLAATIYLLVCFVMMGLLGWGRSGEAFGFLMATLLTGLFVTAYWLALWRNSVNWTGARIGKTTLAGLGCVSAGVVLGATMSALSRINDPSFGIFIGGLVAIVSWLPLTVVVWKETAQERTDRLRQAATDVLFCPRCGYNMTGLYEARCPECGARFTINQLYAAQQKHEIADAAAPREENA
ncbi:MAG TPA: hypothetical protein PKY77_07330 [Phycisphaerae bacterium]|nr:hypothetical protein [Phycisphaerae bacterium]HRY67814.1 hypothetical protein [Phycisphaerae bacterium]HSA25267.1 hypothetical protein [Phycisphaerae bacterium]